MSGASLTQAATVIHSMAINFDYVDISLTGVAANACLVTTGSYWSTTTGFVLSTVTDGGDTFTSRVGTDDSGPYSGFALVSHTVGVSSGNKTVRITTSGRGSQMLYATSGLMEWAGIYTGAAEDDWATKDNISIDPAYVTVGGTGFSTSQADTLIVGSAYIETGASEMSWVSPTSWTNRYRQPDGSGDRITHDSGTWLPDAVQTDYEAAWSHLRVSGNTGASAMVALKVGTYTAPRIIHPTTNRQLMR